MNLALSRLEGGPPLAAPRSHRHTKARFAEHTDSILAGVDLAPASVHEAFDCLSIVGRRLRDSGDPRAAFTDVYAVITRRVRDSIDGRGPRLFDEPQFISRLAGRFCRLYLDALRRSLMHDPEPIGAWAVANGPRGRDRLLPVQHALLGLNAHINFDLAIGLSSNVRALGGAADPETMARYRHDHDAVNRILDEAFPEVMDLLAERYGCRVARIVVSAGRLPSRAARGVTMRALRAWRARVWLELEELLAAASEAEAGRVRARMDLRASLFARLFSVAL